MIPGVRVFRVANVGTGTTMRSRRTGALAIFEDEGSAHRSASAFRGYYGHSIDVRVEELDGQEQAGGYVELFWVADR